jgi:hypothetical protein
MSTVMTMGKTKQKRQQRKRKDDVELVEDSFFLGTKVIASQC